MKTPIIVAALVATLVSGSAAAEGWLHASPEPGQHNGSYQAGDDIFEVNYACNPSFSQIGFRAAGMHVAPGESLILVDGNEIYRGNTTYNSKWDATTYSIQIQEDWGDRLKSSYNDLLEAMAAGVTATWKTPSGESFPIDLSGSADIRSCKMLLTGPPGVVLEDAMENDP